MFGLGLCVLCVDVECFNVVVVVDCFLGGFEVCDCMCVGDVWFLVDEDMMVICLIELLLCNVGVLGVNVCIIFGVCYVIE